MSNYTYSIKIHVTNFRKIKNMAVCHLILYDHVYAAAPAPAAAVQSRIYLINFICKITLVVLDHNLDLIQLIVLPWTLKCVVELRAIDACVVELL